MKFLKMFNSLEEMFKTTQFHLAAIYFKKRPLVNKSLNVLT